MSIGHQYISALLEAGNVIAFVSHGNIGHLFREHEKPYYEFVADFVHKHAVLPKPDTVEKHVGDLLQEATEPASYYLDLLKQRYTENRIKEAMKAAQDWLKPASKNPDAALEELIKSCMELVSKKFDQQVMDFRNAYSLLQAEHNKQNLLEDSERLFTGWEYLDELSGGYGVGDLISIVGRPQQGKTWLMLYAAMHGWRPRVQSLDKTGKKQVIIPGQSRMFVSMEMKPLVIAQRMAAMHTKVPYGHLDKGELSTKFKTKLKSGMLEVEGFDAPFWIIDGNLTATVDDIWMLARQLDPASLWIDGGYLVKHPTETDRYKRVAENAEMMKSKLADERPTVVSWQFARTASKKSKSKKPGDKVDLEDIGYTDAIGQVSSTVLALLQGDGDVEAVKTKLVDLMKGRKGESGQFPIHWDFGPNMDFSQVVEQDVEDLNFLD